MSSNSATAKDLSSLFDASYFQTGLGLPYERNDHWLNFFGLVADEIIRSLKPRTVFDAGCALGFLVEAFWDRGVVAKGVDISEFAISQVRRDMQPYCKQSSLTAPIEGKYDLVTCIEVLEHLLPEQTETVIANITAAADTVLFSSSPSDFTEPTHFNVRPLINWLSLFAQAGFWPDCLFDASFLAPHAVLLRRQNSQPEEMLSLFSEKIRLKCALVEREQRIGNLNATISRTKMSEDQAAQLSLELDSLKTENAHISSDLSHMRGENTRLSSTLNALCEENGKLIDEKGKLINELKDARVQHGRMIAQAERQTGDRLVNRDELTHLSNRLKSLQEANTGLQDLEIHLRDKLAAAEGEQGRLQGELDHINRSAAWQFTVRYRHWIEKHRNAALLRIYERGTKWALRAAGVNRYSSPHPAPSIAASTQNSLPDVSATPRSAESLVPVQLSVASDDSPEPQVALDHPVAQPTNLVKETSVETYDSWYSRTEPDSIILKLQEGIARNFRLQPLITVLVPVFKVPLEVLQAMVESVSAQTYQNWELCIVHSYPADIEGAAISDSGICAR